MKVFIYRHAQAEDSEPDESRILTRKGKMQAKSLAKALPDEEFAEVSELWHSPLVRARETAVQFKKYMRVLDDVEMHAVHELEPDADVMVMACLLGQCEGDVIAVGHNPFLEELLTALCAGEPGVGMIELKKGGMVCLERTTEASKHIPAGLWTIQWYLTPRLLG